jgi:2,4-dienoyl-CoA reductase-like NADH-dependent reductase (Old Yellow Enzyme family)/thioredoxin reductase
MSLHHVFQPYTLKHLTLKNRIVSTAHSPSYAEDCKPKQRYQLYHEEKVRGGVSMTMFGGSSTVSADSPASFGQLSVAEDSVIPYFQEFAKRIHAYGAALICQITHMGRRTTWDTGDWLPPVSSSPIREPAHKSFPRAMLKEDFARIASDFGSAAWRCKEGGLDGCELFISGHLLGQFWSPAINYRTDEYGGSLENRLRFTFEVLDEIRRRVGSAFLVGLRFSADEMIPNGLNLDDTIEISLRLAKSGLVDYLNLVSSNNWTNIGLSKSVPTMAYGFGPALELVGRIRNACRMPVIHAGRINDLATAEHALASGHVDLVGMTRALIADPHHLAKHIEGQERSIRPCVGAGYCIDRIYRGRESLCIHNAATGREQTMAQTIRRSARAGRKVVVIGAGPGGLEAARVCAERGHHVVVFEAAAQAGGQVLLAAKAGWRRDLIGIVQWRLGRLSDLGVHVHYNRLVEATEVLAQNPDVIIVATGGIPNTAVCVGAENVTSSWEILSGEVEPLQRVLLFDDHGHHQGLSTAEVMAEAGSSVELVSPEREIGSELGPTNFAIHLRNLYRLKVRMTPNTRLAAVRRSGNQYECVLRNEYDESEELRQVDQVIVEHGTLPVDDLFLALKNNASNGGAVGLGTQAAHVPNATITRSDGKYQLFRIGDAVASRNIHAAVFDALRICQDL